MENRDKDQGVEQEERDSGMGSVKTIPLTRMRKTIIKRLSDSEKNTLRVTMMMEIDMSRIVQLREKLVHEVKDVRISYTDIIVKATIDTLKKHSILNSKLEEDKITLFDIIHVGVAVSLKGGVIVPVIHNANEMSLLEISLTLRKLVEKARTGKLSLDDVVGGTFTITNLGPFGVDMFTPIINPPQSAILAIGRIVEKPVVVMEKIVKRHMMVINLCFDHRIIDGFEAAKFLQDLKRALESTTNPIIQINELHREITKS